MNEKSSRSTQRHTWCTFNNIYYFELAQLEKKCIKYSIITIMKIPKPNRIYLKRFISLRNSNNNSGNKKTTSLLATYVDLCVRLRRLLFFRFYFVVQMIFVCVLSFTMHNMSVCLPACMCKYSVFCLPFLRLYSWWWSFFPHIHIFILTCTAFCKNVNTFSLVHLIPSIIISLCEVIKLSNAQYVSSNNKKYS